MYMKIEWCACCSVSCEWSCEWVPCYNVSCRWPCMRVPCCSVVASMELNKRMFLCTMLVHYLHRDCVAFNFGLVYKIPPRTCTP
jgi:hypothetical protein